MHFQLVNIICWLPLVALLHPVVNKAAPTETPDCFRLFHSTHSQWLSRFFEELHCKQKDKWIEYIFIFHLASYIAASSPLVRKPKLNAYTPGLVASKELNLGKKLAFTFKFCKIKFNIETWTNENCKYYYTLTSRKKWMYRDFGTDPGGVIAARL